MSTGTNYTAMLFFFIFVGATLVITYWAARRTKTAEHFYAAGRSITGFQNGLALAGDYMSAASFLGIAGLVALNGFDGLIYSTGWLVGWPIILFLIAEPLRNLGKYTFTDVVAYRLQQKPVRVASAIGTMAVVLTYLIAQMVGSGTLIQLLFGLNYTVAVIIVGVVMMTYVLFGGMIATTWVQIIKAGLLLGGATVMALLVLAKFGFNPVSLFAQAAQCRLRSERADRFAAVLLRPGCAGPGHQGGDRSLGRRLARHGADVRHGRPAAHPDALLHRAERQGGARLGDVGDDLDRLLLSRSPSSSASARWCWSGRRASWPPAAAATWRRRCSRRSSPATSSSASSAPSPSPPSWRWSPASRWPAPARSRTTCGSTWSSGGHAPESEQLRVARIASIILGICADPPRHRLPGAERRLHGRPDLLDRRIRQLPGAGDVGVLEEASPPGARSAASCSARSRRCC